MVEENGMCMTIKKDFLNFYRYKLDPIDI
jgi:hypothetical protein